MAEQIREDNVARPGSGRAFLHSTEKSACRTSLWQGTAVPPLKAQIIFWSLMVLGLVLDLWSKSAVFNWLQQQQNQSVSIINGFLQLVLMENTGAAFGIATGQRYLLITVSIVALIVIFGIFLVGQESANSWSRVYTGNVFSVADIIKQFRGFGFVDYSFPLFRKVYKNRGSVYGTSFLNYSFQKHVRNVAQQKI